MYTLEEIREFRTGLNALLDNYVEHKIVSGFMEEVFHKVHRMIAELNIQEDFILEHRGGQDNV